MRDVRVELYIGKACKRAAEVVEFMEDFCDSMIVSLRIIDIDVDDNGVNAMRTLRKHKLTDLVGGIPFVLLFSDGEVVDAQSTFPFDDDILEALIDKYR